MAGINVIASLHPLTVCIYETFKLNIEDKEKQFLNYRLEQLENAITNLEFFQQQLFLLVNDENKLIHLKQFLRYYLYQSDTSLIELNIKVLLDYIYEKNQYSIYDILLDKMCDLNKYAIDILKDLKEISKNKEKFYFWKDILQLYNFPSNLTYTEILCSENITEPYIKVAYGLKSLLENDFIANYNTLYPGDLETFAFDKFKLSKTGILLTQYL